MKYLTGLLLTAAIVLGTVYEIEAAANLAKFYIWPVSFLAPAVYAYASFAIGVSEEGPEREKLAAEFVEKIAVTRTVIFGRWWSFGLTLLMAAYGWTFTAGVSLLSLCACILLRGVAHEAAKQAVKRTEVVV